MKVGRNDPCPCGSGQKYKKCCIDKDLSILKEAVTPPKDTVQSLRQNLDVQLAKFAPSVTVAQVEEKIRQVLKEKEASEVNVMVILQEIFSDDNLNLKNKKQADRLFKAILNLWTEIAAQEKK